MFFGIYSKHVWVLQLQLLPLLMLSKKFKISLIANQTKYV